MRHQTVRNSPVLIALRENNKHSYRPFHADPGAAIFIFFTRGQKSLVIYPISGNNATQKIDFTDRENEVSCNLFYILVGSEMIHLPSRINVRRINLNKKFSRSSRPVLLNFSEIHRKTLVFVSLFNKVAAG